MHFSNFILASSVVLWKLLWSSLSASMDDIGENELRTLLFRRQAGDFAKVWHP